MGDAYVVVAAIDLEPLSSLVFERAVLMASRVPKGELHVLTVVEPLPIATYPGFSPPPDATTAPGLGLEFCNDRIAQLKTRWPDLRVPKVEVHTAVGRPVDEIVWLAAHLDADAVVLATHGRRGLRRLFMGSVAEKVVRLVGCPVMIVREKDHHLAHKIPEIEPICPDCATRRHDTAGGQLWCERHSERHVRAHAYGYGGIGSEGPKAWSSATGT